MKDETPIRVRRRCSALELADSGQRILHLCSTSAKGLSSNYIQDVQTGIPDLFAIKNSMTDWPLYFELLSQWLVECDQDHECHQKAEFYPTRLIFVGDSDPNKLRLVEQASLLLALVKGAGQMDYLALSHCWGRPTTDEKKRYCTTPENIRKRRKGFTFEDLPKTFQDAVQVTRKLGKRFLWIDSLCIIQEEEGKSDWKRESKLMEQVFSSAYCTIAATSAVSWKEGFLERKSTIQSVQVQDVSGNRIHVCNNVDNFNDDVEDGNLNKRGWVLQERVLSRRIIHFTKRHTYWECGEGVRCENFTRMATPPGKQYFLLDPKFPDRLTRSGYYRTVQFLQYLFQQYARCGLSLSLDREIAISGLMERMKRVFQTEQKHGVFARYLAGLLLWRRSEESTTGGVFEDQPSWSWMRYTAIEFERVPHDILVADDATLRFSAEEKALVVKFRSFQNCTVEHGTGAVLIAESRIMGTWWFETTLDPKLKQNVVVVGVEVQKRRDLDKTCWVLVTQKSSEDQYRRVGIGKIEARYISEEGHEGRLL